MIVSKNFEHKKVPIVPSLRKISEIGGKHYTPEDNYRIYLACVDAAKYMEGYGQAPQQPQIDLSHYSKGVTAEKETKVEVVYRKNESAKPGVVLQCPMCGRYFTKSKDRIFCSMTCMKQYNRERDE